MKIKSALLVLAMVGLLGCDEMESKKQPEPAPAPRVVHHFDPITKSEGNLAVDTATGQMCKTWEWACTKPTFYNPYTKETQDNLAYGISCAAIADMPTCKSISDQK